MHRIYPIVDFASDKVVGFSLWREDDTNEIACHVMSINFCEWQNKEDKIEAIQYHARFYDAVVCGAWKV